MRKYSTPLGELKIEPLGHGSVRFVINGKKIYVDPYSEAHNYEDDAPADLILITHNHYDHFDENAISEIETPETLFLVGSDVPVMDDRFKTLLNCDSYFWEGIHIKAVEAFNIKHKKPDGSPFHPQGVGNGYLLDFGGFTVYVAGDTEPIPYMHNLKGVDVAFLPKNLPYTMDDDEFIEAANIVAPKWLYPYHFFELDAEKLRGRLAEGITLVTPDE